MPAWDDVVKHPRRFRTVGLDAVFDTAREVNDIPLLANRSPIAQHQLYFAFQYVEYLILILVNVYRHAAARWHDSFHEVDIPSGLFSAEDDLPFPPEEGVVGLLE